MTEAPQTRSPRETLSLVLLALGAATTFVPGVTAPLALTAGILLALALGNPLAKRTGRLAGTLLRVCVVGLGFGMSLRAVADAAAQGLAYTVAAVLVAFSLGLLLGRLLRVDSEATLLVASGTSICGGSAIAAVGSAVNARHETMSGALGIVFLLNALALYAFPFIGHALQLTQTQFAIWAATAIHDTSSVVAASALYGQEALAQATVLKLTRTLWLIPLVIGAVWVMRRRHADPAAAPGSKATSFPWFPVLFLLAVVVRTLAPASVAPSLGFLAQAARRTLPLVLFLIGSSLTRASLRSLGVRPFVLAALLWLFMSSTLLAAVLLFAR